MSLKELQYSGDHGSGILRVSYTLVFLLDQELSSSPCHEVIDHPSPQGREHGEEIGDCPEYPSLGKQHTVEVLGGKALWKVGVHSRCVSIQPMRLKVFGDPSPASVGFSSRHARVSL